jgi:hypothetical protein
MADTTSPVVMPIAPMEKDDIHAEPGGESIFDDGRDFDTEDLRIPTEEPCISLHMLEKTKTAAKAEISHSAERELEVCTDSGYASTEKFRYIIDKQQHNSSQTPQESVGKEDADETETVFSSASTTNAPFISDSSDWVCDDIHDKIREVVDAKGYVLLSRHLPRFLKAFAVQLGGDGSDPSCLKMMYFVYKHHE